MKALLTSEDARAAAIDYVQSRSLSVVVAELAALRDDAGWVVWLQGPDYLRSRDPMDFVVAPPLLITAGPTVTPLPTAIPVSAALEVAGLALA